SILILISIALYLSNVSSKDLVTDELRRNAGNFFCGKLACKDDEAMTSLQKFKECVETVYPDEVAAIVAIRESQLGNPDECVRQMRTQVNLFRHNDPTGALQVLALV
ncbi:unnamed protein product, partial [Oppiella nova]